MKNYGREGQLPPVSGSTPVENVVYDGERVTRFTEEVERLIAPAVGKDSQIKILASSQCSRTNFSASCPPDEFNGSQGPPWAERAANLTYADGVPLD